MNIYQKFAAVTAVIVWMCFSTIASAKEPPDISGNTASSTFCQTLASKGRDGYWLKNGTRMPIQLRNIADEALSGDLVKFKKTYYDVVKRSKTIDATYANIKPNSLRDQNYVEDQLIAALDDAVLTGHTSIIVFLVRHGVNPNYTSRVQQEPAIMQAVMCNRTDSMQKLFELGANVNAQRFDADPNVQLSKTGSLVPINALEQAIFLARNESLSWLLSHGVNVCTPEAIERIKHLLSDPRIKARIDTSLKKKLECRR